MSLVFLYCVEKHKVTNLKFYICVIIFPLAYSRIIENGYEFNEINLISITLASPVLVKAFAVSKITKSRSLYFALADFIIILFIAEYFILYLLRQIKIKIFLSQSSPASLTDTDEKLLLIINTFWSTSVLFYYLGSEFVLMSFVFSTLPATAYMYFITGLGKIQISWAKYNVISYLNKSSIVQLNWFALSDSILMILNKSLYFVLIFEISSIVFLLPLYPRISFFYIGALCLFHIAIFFTCGINFWKWILSNLILMFCIYLVQFEYTYDTNSILTSITIFILSILYFYKYSDLPIKLSWYDSPLSRVFKIYVKDAQNNEKCISPYNIFPYDTTLSQNRLQFLFPDEKYVTGCLGTVQNLDLYKKLLTISNTYNDKLTIKNETLKLIDEFGVSPDPESSISSIQKLMRFIADHQSILATKPSILSKFFAHIHSRFSQSSKVIDDNIVSVRITLSRKLFSYRLNKFIDIQDINKFYNI